MSHPAAPDRTHPPADASVLDAAVADTAVARHIRLMHRQRRWYLATVAAVAILVGLFVARVWSTSEITHAHLHTAAALPGSVVPGVPTTNPALAWSANEQAAGGVPFWNHIVVTYSTHTVNGRDATTGAVRWSYTRTDRTLCAVFQEQGNVQSKEQGRTVSIFDHDGNCDEVSAFDTDTGKRAWERTLTDNGHPSYAVSQYTLLMTTPGQVHAIDPFGGIDRWVYTSPPSCRTNSAVLGGAGVLVGQSCSSTGTDNLILLDPYVGKDGAATVKWTVASRLVPATADSMMTAVDPRTRDLAVLDAAKGTTLRSIALSPVPPAATGITSLAVAEGELLRVAGTTYAFDAGDNPVWSVATTGLPTVTAVNSSLGNPGLTDATIAAGTANGIAVLNGTSGVADATYPAAIADGGQVFVYGEGFVVAGPRTAVYR